jgi:hypothetical protein
MTNTSSVEGKYFLKTVHAEIDLYDRRLAHLEKYDTFETEAAKAAATRKLTLKRDALVLTAKRLAGEGVEFKDSELPRSFRPEGLPLPVEEKHEVEAAPVIAGAGNSAENRTARRQGTSFAGAALDWEKSIAQYTQAKKA